MEPSHLAALYNAAPIILWVEDLVTSVYLQTLWQHDRRFQFYIGGGHEVLSAVVEDAHRSGRSHVYCLRDRDFGPTNRPRWKKQETVQEVTSFTLETFEIECFLLDPPALANCVVNTAGRTEQMIDEHLREQAQTSLWWMACRKVLADLREARQANFPKHPKRGQVSSRELAERVLLENPWVKLTAPALPDRIGEQRLRSALTEAHEHYTRLVEQDAWMNAFSGKELVQEMVSWIFIKQRPRANAVALQDLAKAVAREQLAAGRVPQELLELHLALIERLSLV